MTPLGCAVPPSAYADADLTDLPTRDTHTIVAVTVHSRESIARNVLRITVHSPEFQQLALTGPDEFFGLLMPPADQPFVHPASQDGGNIRAAVAAMPPQSRPELRWYTIRKVDSTRGLMSFDVATHGVSDPETLGIGPGLRWCLSARPGDEAGIWTAQGLWHRAHSRQLIVADPSSFPSAASILDFLAEFHPEQLGHTHLVVVAENAHDIEHAALNHYAHRLGSARTLFAPASHFTRATTHCLNELYSEQPELRTEYVWVAGEGDLCKAVRQFAIRSLGLPASQVQWCPYWFFGKARP